MARKKPTPVITACEEVLEEGLMEYPDLKACAVGVVVRFGQPPIACYDYEMVIAQYMADGMGDREEAEEFFDFNTIGGWHGEMTPCFLLTDPDLLRSMRED